jgi:phosphohistidine phosphatase
MQILIMRHGEAQNFVEQGNRDDSQRLLTQQGKQEAQVMANWLNKKSIKPNQVFVSPYNRAQQTCNIVTSLLQTTTTTLDFITPSGDAKQVHDFIDGWCCEKKTESSDQNQCLLIVSHMPLVSYLVAELTQSENAPIFATAGIAQIDYDTETMQGSLLGLTAPLDLV